MKRPAYGKAFEARRLAGWDPASAVVVGVGLWLQRDLPGHEVLVLAEDTPPEILDWRPLAGCDVAIVHGQADTALAERTAAAIAPHLVERLELVCWDARTVRECFPPWSAASLAVLDELADDPSARAHFERMRILPAPWAVRFWFVDLDLTRICAGLDLRRRGERAA